jgi:endonuclease/exonuclease/phosphatase family metal-dependent hydrolase
MSGRNPRKKPRRQPSRFSHWIQVLFLLVTLFCYLSVLISPGILWVFGFFSLIIPFLLALHLLMLLINMRHFNKLFWYHLIALLPAWFFIRATFGFGGGSGAGEGDLAVLSYNVRVFNQYAHLQDKKMESSRGMIEWTVRNEAGIKCLQEYFNDGDHEVFNIEKRLRKAGWKHRHTKAIYADRHGGEFGLAIYSRYPMLRKGEVTVNGDDFQNAIFADVLVGRDTLRIYNVHLQSMAINEMDVVDADRLRKSYRDTIRRLRNGFSNRAGQVDDLVRHIGHCPHPVIVCGDLNEIPYSYPYFTLRRKLNNAFEEAGLGFGFSFNGMLFFLRIDQQFFSDRLEATSFRTLRDVKYSDHFPLTATYRWKREN